MIVVSNTSPIVNLAAVGQLELLRQLYGTVLIPQAVYHKVAVLGNGLPGSVEVDTCDWIENHQVRGLVRVTFLQLEVDEGEAETIVLAAELGADLLLLDEPRGRVFAARLGLKLIGRLGVLIEAEHSGYIQAVNPILDDLLGKAGFWISRELYDRVL